MSIAADTLVAGSQWVMHRRGWLLGIAALAIVASAAAGMLGLLWYAVLLLLFAALVASHPLNAFLVFVVLTPVHTIGMILVYGLVGEPGLQMTLFLAWKELVLLITLLVLFGVLDRGTLLLRPSWPDRLAALYMALAVLFVVVPRIAGDTGGLGARLYGFRESVLPPLVYLVGRAVPALWSRLDGALRILVAATAVWCIIALVEALIDPGDLLRAMGYTQFQIEVLQAGGELNAEGLAYTYRTGAGLRRVGSVFLHPLGFAIALLFVLPLLLLRLLDRRPGYLVLTALGVAALFATISRGPLAAFVLSVGLLMLWRERISARTLAYAGLAVVTVSVPFVAAGPLRQFAIDTLTGQDSSTLARLANWGARLATLAANPVFGRGVSSATREGEVGGAESELLQVALRFGFVGLGLYLAFVASLVALFWRRRRAVRRAEFIWAGVSLLTLNIYALINPLWRSGFHTLAIWFAWGLLATRALEDPPAPAERGRVGP